MGYSAKVRLDLVVDECIIPLAQVGPDHVILAAPALLSPGSGETVVYIDGIPHRSKVEILPHEPGVLRIPLRRIAKLAPGT